MLTISQFINYNLQKYDFFFNYCSVFLHFNIKKIDQFGIKGKRSVDVVLFFGGYGGGAAGYSEFRQGLIRGIKKVPAVLRNRRALFCGSLLRL